MANIPITSTTLLRDLAVDSQHARWVEFVARYRPMMEAFMRERFPSLDADDTIQETLAAVCRIMPSYRYDPDGKGHFRNYLTGILRNKALNSLRKKQRQSQTAAEAGYLLCQFQNSTPSLESEEQEWRTAVFETALARFLADPSIADRTKRIFERTAIGGESPESVATSFKMTRHAVDQAKSRALAQIRELVKTLESATDEL